MKNIIMVTHKKKLIAIIIKANFKKDGYEFFTPDNSPQQIGHIGRPKGYIISPHIHMPFTRTINFTQEVVFLKKGKIRIDFYDEKRHYIESRFLNTGDAVFLAYGGHGFEFIQNTELIEVKQGPYTVENSTVKFNSISKKKLKVKK